MHACITPAPKKIGRNIIILHFSNIHYCLGLGLVKDILEYVHVSFAYIIFFFLKFIFAEYLTSV